MTQGNVSIAKRESTALSDAKYTTGVCVASAINSPLKPRKMENNQTPSECRHYVEMLGYCELRNSWSMACNLCPYKDEDCDCPNYEPKEKKPC